MTETPTNAVDLARLVERLEVLEAEADIRRIQARYMFLCDTPEPEHGVTDRLARIEAVLELYTEDAVWEGVGEYYDGQFGRLEGKQQLREHFERFWPAEGDRELVLNAHYLTSEQIHVHDDRTTADGQWIHFQPWLFSDGTGVLRGSRLNNLFRRVDGTWKVQRTRTENVFVVDLPDNWPSSYPTTSVLMRP